MFLEQIAIKNFRNLENQVLCFNRKINIIQGLNAQGKTNLLEAIYFLAVSRSFRTVMDSEIINFTSPNSYFHLKGILTRKAGKKNVEIGYQLPQRLQIKVNGSPIKRADYIHRNPVVVFVPDDLLLIKEGPSFRRRFLNLESSRLEPLYYQSLKDYNRVLQQRNRILKEKKSISYSTNYSTMQPWNEVLIRLGSQLIRKRTAILKNIEKQARIFFQGLTASEEKLSLQYSSSVPYGETDRIEYYFEKKLNETARQELIRGSTLVGPHLDDFTVCIDDHDAKKFASQGQQRTAVLAIKMGEINLFGHSADENTVVLLDDVFSEFDRKRRKQLLEFLFKREGQSFITTASYNRNTDIDGAVQIFLVDKGKIIDEQAGANC